MATKKKSKKQTKSKKSVSTKPTPMKKAAPKKPTPLKKMAKKKASPKKAATKTKAGAKKTSGEKSARKPLKQTRGRSESVPAEAFSPETEGPNSGGQSGDLQGLPDTATADSESVDELLDEGNAFEAEVVLGVEDALDPDEGEVRTKEVPEDDVTTDDDEQG